MMKAAMYYEFGQPIHIVDIPKPTIRHRRTTRTSSLLLSDNNNKNDNNDHNNDNKNDNNIYDIDCIIIKIMATGICRSDWHGWKGHDNDIKQHGLPFIPGHEMTGIIVDMSDDILLYNNDNHNHNNHNNNNQILKIDDRVIVPFILSCHQCVLCCHYKQPTVCSNQQQPGFTMYGSYAEYIKISRASHNVVRLPDNVTYQQATSLGCRFTTAYRALIYHGQLLEKQPLFEALIPRHYIEIKRNDNQYNYGKTIGIFGCGGLGLSCIMLMNGYNEKYKKENNNNNNFIYKIIAIDISIDALRKAKSISPLLVETFHIQKEQHKQDLIIDSINSLTPYQLGFDITIECSGIISSNQLATYCTRPGGGKMLQVGILSEPKIPTTPSPPTKIATTSSSSSSSYTLLMNHILSKEINIIGSHGFDGYNDLSVLLQMISEQYIHPEQLIDKEVSLRTGIQILQNMDYVSPLGITLITSFHDDNDNDKDNNLGNDKCNTIQNNQKGDNMNNTVYSRL